MMRLNKNNLRVNGTLSRYTCDGGICSVGEFVARDYTRTRRRVRIVPTDV
jgi:hypothetical protein